MQFPNSAQQGPVTTIEWGPWAACGSRDSDVGTTGLQVLEDFAIQVAKFSKTSRDAHLPMVHPSLDLIKSVIVTLRSGEGEDVSAEAVLPPPSSLSSCLTHDSVGSLAEPVKF